MSQAIMKRFSPDGNTTFDIQDARVDSIINNTVPSVNTLWQTLYTTLNGKNYGISNTVEGGLGLTNGGYYEDATVFELREQSIVLENVEATEYEHDFTQIDDAAYIDWIKNGSPVGIFVMGTNGKDEFGYQFDGHFEEDTNNAGTYIFGCDNAATIDYGISAFKVVLDDTTPQYLFYVSKDERNEDTLHINEMAMYLPEFAAMPFPGDMIEAGDGIIASGSGLRIDTDWLEHYLINNFGLTPSGSGS